MIDELTGRAIGRDIAAGERTEAELDQLVSRCHDRRVVEEGERPLEEAWKASERRHNARLRAENEAAWVSFHRGQAERHRRTLEALVRGHEEAAARIEGGAA